MTRPSELTFAWLTLAKALSAGIEDLLVRHWEEVALNQDDTPLSPNWNGYQILERTGVLKAVAAWRDNRLVGYNVFFVQPTLHYSTSLWAVNDILYLDPAERRGLTGAKLVRVSETMLATLGVQKVFYHAKLHVNLGHGKAHATVGDLLVKLGYGHVENVFAKTL